MEKTVLSPITMTINKMIALTESQPKTVMSETFLKFCQKALDDEEIIVKLSITPKSQLLLSKERLVARSQVQLIESAQQAHLVVLLGNAGTNNTGSEFRPYIVLRVKADIAEDSTAQNPTLKGSDLW